MTSVLVTGASGFIGSRLARRLVARGDDVACLVRATSGTARLPGPPARTMIGDLDDLGSLAAAVAGRRVVYHVAGAVRQVGSRRWRLVHRTGTANLLRACAACDPAPVVVLISSLAAAGPSPSAQPLIESDPPRPVSDYGRSKLEGEIEARSICSRLPITIIRPPIVLGETDEGLLPWFRAAARTGRLPCPPRDAARSRLSMIHVEDLVTGIILAAEAGARITPVPPDVAEAGTGLYYMADDRLVTYPLLAEWLAEALGRTVRPLFVPRPLFHAASCGAQLVNRLTRRPGMFGMDKAREAVAGSWTCSAAKARRELAFGVQHDLQDRLQQTIRWYRQNGLIGGREG